MSWTEKREKDEECFLRKAAQEYLRVLRVLSLFLTGGHTFKVSSCSDCDGGRRIISAGGCAWSSGPLLALTNLSIPLSITTFALCR